MPEAQGKITLWGVEVFLAVADEGDLRCCKTVGGQPFGD
jgi:hypothetical protein